MVVLQERLAVELVVDRPSVAFPEHLPFLGDLVLRIPFTRQVLLGLPSYPFGSCHQVGPFSTRGRSSEIVGLTFGPFP